MPVDQERIILTPMEWFVFPRVLLVLRDELPAMGFTQRQCSAECRDIYYQ